jgi:hypothetical protein
MEFIMEREDARIAEHLEHARYYLKLTAQVPFLGTSTSSSLKEMARTHYRYAQLLKGKEKNSDMGVPEIFKDGFSWENSANENQTSINPLS